MSTRKKSLVTSDVEELIERWGQMLIERLMSTLNGDVRGVIHKEYQGQSGDACVSILEKEFTELDEANEKL